MDTSRYSRTCFPVFIQWLPSAVAVECRGRPVKERLKARMPYSSQQGYRKDRKWIV